MYKVKQNSTQQINKIELESCPVNYTLNKIGGRWKALIIYQLTDGPLRYNELKKLIPNISEKMLIQNLKDLENDQLIKREAKLVVPPHVIYSLSDSGNRLKPILSAMAIWGNEQQKS